MKICLLIKSFDNPNGITRCARGLAESDPRFQVIEYKKKVFAKGPLSKISRYTFDEILDAFEIPNIDADVILPVTPVESIPIFIRGNRPSGVIIFDMIHWVPWRDKSSFLFRLYSFILRRYDAAAYKYSSRVFCVSDYVRDQLINQFGNRPELRVVTPGLTQSFIQSAGNFRRKYEARNDGPLLSVLMVPGALTPDEGMEGTIAALGCVKKKYPEKTIVLKLVASRRLEFFPYLRSLGDSQGVDLGLVVSPTDAELLALYSSSNIFVHAGNDDWFHYTPLEAMACGVPTVFATDLPNIGIFESAVKKAGFNDPTTISSAVLSAGFDERQRSDLIKKGDEVVERTSMANAAAKICESFE
jgi:glycosyltransferase involved in cell wall biosynthesis